MVTPPGSKGDHYIPDESVKNRRNKEIPRSKIPTTEQNRREGFNFGKTAKNFLKKAYIFQKFFKNPPSEASKKSEPIRGIGTIEGTREAIQSLKSRLALDGGKTREIEKIQKEIENLLDLAEPWAESKEKRGIIAALQELKHQLPGSARFKDLTKQVVEKEPNDNILLSMEEDEKVPGVPEKATLKDVKKSPPFTSEELAELSNTADPAKEKLAGFFVKAHGNLVIYDQMKALIDENKLEEIDIELETAQLFKSFALWTGTGDVQKMASKLDNLMNKVSEKKPISEEEKLSLGELGWLDSFYTIKDAISIIKELDINDPTLNRFLKDYRTILLSMGQVELILNNYSNYKSGDWIVRDPDKVLKFNQAMNLLEEDHFEDRLAVCCKVVPQSEDPNEMTSPDDKIVFGSSKEEAKEFACEEKVTMQGFRLDPSKLLLDDAKAHLTEMFEKQGKEISVEIPKLYQEIQNEIQLNRNQSNPSVTDTEWAFSSVIQCLEASEKTLKEQLDQFFDESTSKEEKPKIGSIFQIPLEKDQIMGSGHLLDIFGAEILSQIEPPPLLKLILKADDLEKEIGSLPMISGFNADENHLKEMEQKDQSFELVEEEMPRFGILPSNPGIDDKWASVSDKADMIHVAIGSLSVFDKDGIYKEIKKRRKEIKGIRDYWENKMPLLPSLDTFREKALTTLKNGGQLKRASGGFGAAYFLSAAASPPVASAAVSSKVPDAAPSTPLCIVKPLDEDALHLNSAKVASPLDGKRKELRVRMHIPLYQTVQSEVLAYKMAELANLKITPPTEMVIIESDSFHDILDNTKEMKDERILNLCGEPDKKKLCSIQQFIPNSQELVEFLQDFQKNKIVSKNKTLEQAYAILEEMIEQQDVEDCVLFCWLIGETDGNGGNFRVYEGMNESGQKKFRMEKVDNGLAFPDKNKGLSHCLDELPHLGKFLSDRGKKRILNWDVEAFATLMTTYGKSPEAVDAFKNRIACLRKEIEKNEKVTLKELDSAINKLSESKGRTSAEAQVEEKSMMDTGSVQIKEDEDSDSQSTMNTGTFIVDENAEE